jgi:hypothetical protein
MRNNHDRHTTTDELLRNAIAAQCVLIAVSFGAVVWAYVWGDTEQTNVQPK